MAKVSSFESDIDKASVVLADAFKGMDATEATLADHARGNASLDAINFPVEEGLTTETIGLFDRWKAQIVAVLRGLDGATSAAALQFERLFDENAGRESSSFLSRRMGRSHSSATGIVTDVRNLLAASALLDAMLKEAEPVFRRHHHSCEDHLLRIIERRQRADFDIEEAQRRVDALSPRIADRQNRMLSARNAAALAGFEEELKAFTAERQELREKEQVLQPERETLQRLISIHEDFVDALNALNAGLNAMRGKLAVDIEQRIALLKASGTQSDILFGELPAAVGELVAAFDANVMSGYDLGPRKIRADDAFVRRLEPRPAEPEVPAEAEVPA
jgi:DNA-binding transcriptional MerR regulator